MLDCAGLQSALGRILLDPTYLKNIQWGEPRVGHPEGTIANHIDELLGNLLIIEDLIDMDDVLRLKIMVHVHDTFKPNVVSGGQNHGQLAADFLRKFVPSEQDMITMVAQHDTLFGIWRDGYPSGTFDQGRLVGLHQLVSDWDLFAMFMLIDAETIGKDPRPIDWAFDTLEALGYVSDIIPPMKEMMEEEVGKRIDCLSAT